MQVNILEAKNQLSKLIQLAQAGVDITIANRGRPVVRLVRMQNSQTESTTNGFLGWLEAHPNPTHLQRSHVDIELGIAEERAAWD